MWAFPLGGPVEAKGGPRPFHPGLNYGSACDCAHSPRAGSEPLWVLRLFKKLPKYKDFSYTPRPSSSSTLTHGISLSHQHTQLPVPFIYSLCYWILAFKPDCL